MAEGLLRARLAYAGIPGSVSSAGLLYDGEPASAFGVQVLRDRGVDISEHLSRIMQPEHLAQADLVVAMARRHAREAIVMDRSVLGRTFTLKELVRRATERPPREGESTAEYLAELTADRSARELLGDSETDDIVDPIGKPIREYERTAEELDTLIDRLVGLIPDFAFEAHSGGPR